MIRRGIEIGCLAMSLLMVVACRAGSSTLAHRVEAGREVVWLLERRSPSVRGSTWVDGVIVAPAGAGLAVHSIRRQDGDHRVIVGWTGTSGQPIATLKPRLAELRRAQMIPYPIHMRGRWSSATVYAPQGAYVVASPTEGGAMVEVKLPWDQVRPTQNLGEITEPLKRR